MDTESMDQYAVIPYTHESQITFADDQRRVVERNQPSVKINA